jgi:type IV pilus assembly protein PilN
MIKVNLLAASPGTPAAREWLPREQRSAIIGISMLAATALCIGVSWWYLSYTRSSLDTAIVNAEAEIVRLKEAAKLLEATNARRAILAERLSLIERLRASKRAPVSLLETVSRSVPEGLWLLEMKQTGTSLQVDGRALSLTSVTDFAQRMQTSGLFEHPIEIVTTTNEQVDQITVVRFTIRAESAKPRTAAVPTALSATSAPDQPAGRPGV